MNYTVQEVLGTREWDGPNGKIIYYTLRLDGSEKPASLGQKPDRAAPKPGDVLDLTLTENDRVPNVLNAKRAFNGTGGGGPRPMDPKQIAGMQRAHAQEMGLRYAAIRAEKEMLPEPFKLADLKAVIDWFEADVQTRVAQA